MAEPSDDRGPTTWIRILLTLAAAAIAAFLSFVAALFAWVSLFQGDGVQFLFWLGFAMFIVALMAFCLARVGLR